MHATFFCFGGMLCWRWEDNVQFHWHIHRHNTKTFARKTNQVICSYLFCACVFHFLLLSENRNYRPCGCGNCLTKLALYTFSHTCLFLSHTYSPRFFSCKHLFFSGEMDRKLNLHANQDVLRIISNSNSPPLSLSLSFFLSKFATHLPPHDTLTAGKKGETVLKLTHSGSLLNSLFWREVLHPLLDRNLIVICARLWRPIDNVFEFRFPGGRRRRCQ